MGRIYAERRQWHTFLRFIFTRFFDRWKLNTKLLHGKKKSCPTSFSQDFINRWKLYSDFYNTDAKSCLCPTSFSRDFLRSMKIEHGLILNGSKFLSIFPRLLPLFKRISYIFHRSTLFRLSYPLFKRDSHFAITAIFQNE